MLLSQRLKPRRCPRRRAGIEAGFALCFLPTARRSARLHEAVAAVPHTVAHTECHNLRVSSWRAFIEVHRNFILP